MGHAHGTPRGDRVRRRLGDQLRRRRVLVAARRVARRTCSTRSRRATARSARSCATFAPRPDATSTFAERMTVRFSALAPINDPASLFKPIRKVVHRGHPEIRLTRGNHARRRQPVRTASRLVSGRGASTSRCARSPSASTRRGCRGGVGSTSTGRRPRTTRRCTRRSRAALSTTTTRRRSSPTRSSSEASPRAASSSTRGCATRCGRIAAGETQLAFPTADTRRRADVRRRGSRARRGRRRPAAAPPRRARAAPPTVEQRPSERASTASSRGPAKRVLGAASRLTARSPIDHLVQGSWASSSSGLRSAAARPYRNPPRCEHVSVGLDLDVSGAERLFREPPGGAARVVPPLAELLVLERRDLRDARHGREEYAAGREDAVQRRERRAHVVDELERLRDDRAVEGVVSGSAARR